jgi:hypothetical protein
VTEATGAVDTTGPKVTVNGVTIQSATRNGPGGSSKVIDQGDVITFAVNLDEAAIVTGTPTLGFYMGSATASSTANNRTASYDSISADGKTLFFKYTVQTTSNVIGASDNDFDHDGLTFNGNSISLPSGASIKDATGNNADLTYSGNSTSNTEYRVDAVALSGTGNDLLIRGQKGTDNNWYFFLDTGSGDLNNRSTVPNGLPDSVPDRNFRTDVDKTISDHNAVNTNFSVGLTTIQNLNSIGTRSSTLSSNTWPTEWRTDTFSTAVYHVADSPTRLYGVGTSSSTVNQDGSTSWYAALQVI